MTRKKKKLKIFKVIGIITIFIIAFIFLIKRQNDNLGDVKDNNFNVTPIYNEIIVLQDMDSIYNRYFVIYFDNHDNTYLIHSYNYYNTVSQYHLEFNRLKEYIVDYNINEYFIRYIYDKGYGTYQEVIKNISNIVGIRKYKLYN